MKINEAIAKRMNDLCNDKEITNNNNKAIGIMKHLFIDNTIENKDKKKELLNRIIYILNIMEFRYI